MGHGTQKSRATRKLQNLEVQEIFRVVSSASLLHFWMNFLHMKTCDSCLEKLRSFEAGFVDGGRALS